jgi:uncharacterized protein DUF1203
MLHYIQCMQDTINFQISGLPFDPFVRYFSMRDEELIQHHARRVVADSKPGFPCRVSLIDAEPGETLILIAFTHHRENGPYQSSGPIYVREHAKRAQLEINQLPPVAQTRLMSARAYNSDGWMMASGVAEGEKLVELIQQLFADDAVSYLHLHNAKPGCYSCKVDRA